MDKKKNTKIKKEIIQKALRFGKVVKKATGTTPEKIIIFGSYAKNKAKKESDIDIAIISPAFGKNDIEESQLLMKQTRMVDTRIEPHPISSSDYQKTATPLIAEIRKHGVEVK